MKITIFTSNSSRHIALIKSVSNYADEVFVVQECKTVHTGIISDFYDNHSSFRKYFKYVNEAEYNLFGNISFSRSNVRTLSIKLGDLEKIDLKVLNKALDSDYYIVFGSSFIKGELCDFLESNNCLNIHLGISPYYRGNSCNFWSTYDRNFHLTGATIHKLTKGLDSGPVLFHALPSIDCDNTFDFTMLSVKAAIDGIENYITNGLINKLIPLKQSRELEIRYTKNIDFNIDVSSEFLNKLEIINHEFNSYKKRNFSGYINPFWSI